MLCPNKVLVACVVLLVAACARAEEWGESPEDYGEVAGDYEFALADDEEEAPRGPPPDVSDENGEQFVHLRAECGVRFPPSYKGCYQDRGLRDMKGKEQKQRTRMTIGRCQALCARAGFKYAGLEWRHECFCDNDFGSYGRLQESRCNLPCRGDSRQKCGGSWALSVYETAKAPYPFVGCYVDQPTRTLSYPAVTHRNRVMRRQYCCDTCAQKGYKYCGTEYAYECFCGNRLQSRQRRKFTDCADTCSGGTFDGEKCGDAWRISIYRTTGATMAWAYYYGTRAGGAGALAVLALAGWRAYRRQQEGGDEEYETPKEHEPLL